jgi:hypothetical protein
MKTKLPEIRSSFLQRHDIGSGDLCIAQGFGVLRYSFDFDVFLPTKRMNLQRSLVWTPNQQQALIESIIVRRSIPPISVIQLTNDVYQVIDGKQRLSTFIEYLKDKFTFCGYYCSELPKEYLGQIKRHYITAYRLCEYDTPISDNDKIEWFKWINFAGTQQDISHMEELLR